MGMIDIVVKYIFSVTPLTAELSPHLEIMGLRKMSPHFTNIYLNTGDIPLRLFISSVFVLLKYRDKLNFFSIRTDIIIIY